MKIQILLGLQNAHKAEGLAVVIDVFRAFTTACYLFDQGVSRVFPVSSLEEARSLKKKYPALKLVGENEGIKPLDFDIGNSPSEVMRASVKNKDIVLATSLGTKALLASQKEDFVVSCALVNVHAVADYIQQQNTSIVSIVCSGSQEGLLDEDLICAEYLQRLLQGNLPPVDGVLSAIRKTSNAAMFFDENRASHPESDYDLCVSIGKFNFILMTKMDPQNGLISLIRANI